MPKLSDADLPEQAHPFADLFPRLRDDDLAALAQDIRQHGQRQPIILYQRRILDGRNRASALALLQGVEPKFTTFEGSEDEALALVISLNLQRRHLNTAQRAVLALQILPLEEAAARRRQGTRTDLLPQTEGSGGTALDLAGRRVGVGRDTLWKTRTIATDAPEVFEAMRDGSLSSVASAAKLAALPQTKRRRLLRRIRDEGLSLQQAQNVYRRGADDEGHTQWYTPPTVIASVVQALGGPIDLDPASCMRANDIVGAARYFTPVDNGLAQEWNSPRVFVNPPYGFSTGTNGSGNSSSQGRWVAKALAEFEAGRVEKIVLLVRNSVGANWFWPLWQHPVCLVRGRLPFVPGPGAKHDRVSIGSAIVGLGIEHETFVAAFGELGRVVLPTDDKGVSSGR